jgi:hypothetical protein
LSTDVDVNVYPDPVLPPVMPSVVCPVPEQEADA